MRLIVIVAAALAFTAPPLFAHAFIDHANPAVGSKSPSAPAQVRIWFTQTIEAAFSSIKICDGSGHEVQRGKATVDKANPRLLQVALSSVPDGTYKVTWRAVCTDSHVTTGSYTFSVGP